MVILDKLTSKQDPDGSYSFVAHLLIDRRPFTLPLNAVEVLSYQRFQLALLLATGRVFTTSACEGRLPEAADSYWHLEVDFLLAESAKPAQTAGQMN